MKHPRNKQFNQVVQSINNNRSEIAGISTYAVGVSAVLYVAGGAFVVKSLAVTAGVAVAIGAAYGVSKLVNNPK